MDDPAINLQQAYAHILRALGPEVMAEVDAIDFRCETGRPIPREFKVQLFNALYHSVEDVLFCDDTKAALTTWYLLRLFKRWIDEPMPPEREQ